MKFKSFPLMAEIFITFFKIGAFTIGGGYAMLPLIEKEVVDKKNWVKSEEIIDIFAIVQSLPGVIAINSSIFIGYKKAGIKGAIAASLGVILPSFVIILIISEIMLSLKDNIYMKDAFTGIKSGVTALITITTVNLAKKTLKNKISWIIALISFILLVFFSTHIAIIIALAGVTGYLIYGIKKVAK